MATDYEVMGWSIGIMCLYWLLVIGVGMLLSRPRVFV